LRAFPDPGLVDERQILEGVARLLQTRKVRHVIQLSVVDALENLGLQQIPIVNTHGVQVRIESPTKVLNMLERQQILFEIEVQEPVGCEKVLQSGIAHLDFLRGRTKASR